MTPAVYQHSARFGARRIALNEAAIADSIKDRIKVHGVRRSTGTRVYEHPKAEVRRAVEAIAYAGLKRPRVYTAN